MCMVLLSYDIASESENTMHLNQYTTSGLQINRKRYEMTLLTSRIWQTLMLYDK